jgi:hypothetical protein
MTVQSLVLPRLRIATLIHKPAPMSEFDSVKRLIVPSGPGYTESKSAPELLIGVVFWL